MSARDQMTIMLNELMGPRRNATTGATMEVHFYDDEVCKFFLAGFCPHELFTNTKADLGLCTDIHDEELRNAYINSEKFEKLGYEDLFLSYLRRLQNDIRRKIQRNNDRLALTQPEYNPPTGEKRLQLEHDVEEMTRKINECVREAETLGAEGKIDESQELISKSDQFIAERERLRKILAGAPMPTFPIDENAAKPMEVCDICGCFLILGDAQQRIDEHFVGKQHVGYAKIKTTIEELETRFAEKEKARIADREQRRKTREKDNDRDSRRTSRDRHRISSSNKRSKSRDRGSHRRRSRSRSKEQRSSKHRHEHGRKSEDTKGINSGRKRDKERHGSRERRSGHKNGVNSLPSDWS